MGGESGLTNEIDELHEEVTAVSASGVQPPAPAGRRNIWLKVLISATAFYILLLVALLMTGNPNLFPSLVMVGNFTVPVAYVAFLYERKNFSRLKMPIVSLAFLYGGGWWVSSLLLL